MRVNKKFLSLIMGATLSLSASAAGLNGSGVRGGGHVIDVDSSPVLMDFVTKAVCEWKSGDDFILELQPLRDTLSKIERLDWYFAADLKDEIRSLNFCMTGALRTVPTNGLGSVIGNQKNELAYQAGYRLYRDVFIDSEIYRAMKSDESRTMLVLHETLHSYLSMSTPERALKLRSFVKVIEEIRKGEIFKRDDLHYNMRMNNISFPQGVSLLTSKKKEVLFFKGDMSYKKSALLKMENPESLLDLTTEQTSRLASWDYDHFGSESKRLNIIQNTMISIMQNSTGSEIRELLEGKHFEKINLAQLAMAELYSFSAEQREAIISSSQFTAMFNLGFDEIINEKLESKDFLLTASDKLVEILTGQGSGEAPVITLKSSTRLPEKLKWLVGAMIVLNENQSLSIVTENEKFYQALGLKNQKTQVQSASFRIERERRVALERLSMISSDLVNSLLQELQNRVEKETYETILKQIKLTNF